MPRDYKRRRVNCHGSSCRQPECTDCEGWLELQREGLVQVGAPGSNALYGAPPALEAPRSSTQPTQRWRPWDDNMAAIRDARIRAMTAAPVQQQQQQQQPSSYATGTFAHGMPPQSAHSDDLRLPPVFYFSHAPVTSEPPNAAAPPASRYPPPFRQMVAEMDAQVLRAMIVDLAPRTPGLVSAVKERYSSSTAAPTWAQAAAPSRAQRAPQPSSSSRAPVPLSQMRPAVDFDRYSKEAWHALNDRELLRLSGSRQYERAGDVWEAVAGCIAAVGAGLLPGSSSCPLRTRQSAVETLRKIAKTVILGEDTVGDEVRKELQTDTSIADGMLAALAGMTPAERRLTGQRRDEKGTLLDKIEWVRDQAEAHCLGGLDGLNDVLALMDPDVSGP